MVQKPSHGSSGAKDQPAATATALAWLGGVDAGEVSCMWVKNHQEVPGDKGGHVGEVVDSVEACARRDGSWMVGVKGRHGSPD